MCGIAGFVGDWGREDLFAMLEEIKYRGPDDHGAFYTQGVALGHRRLSIIDLTDAARQPMQFEDLVMVYNGEVYNYMEIRNELRGLGYSFTTQSDSEVVLKAFHCWGTRCASRFIGMFAIAVYDIATKMLFLLRDRVGVKPLYYWHCGNQLLFGSEVKSLANCVPSSTLNRKAVSDFLSIGYSLGEHTIVEGIFRLKPGHFLTFSEGRLRAECYWKPEFRIDPALASMSEPELIERLVPILDSAFRYRMVADVPVGVFLSSGVDSSLVGAILSRYSNLRTFTVGFESAEFDESQNAQLIAKHLNTHHTTIHLDGKEAVDILSTFYTKFDEPIGDASCLPTYAVSKAAVDNGVKVVLSADGGDELFGGYGRYPQYLKRWSQLSAANPTIRKAISYMLRLLNHFHSSRVARLCDILERTRFTDFYQTIIRASSTKELTNVFPEYEHTLLPAKGNVSALHEMCAWDLENYLVDDILAKVDRATMANSIEGREPFLDHRLIEFSCSLPPEHKIRGQETKFLLKGLLTKYLPRELCYLPKRGFGIPFQSWMSINFKPLICDTLTQLQNPVLNPRAVRQLRDAYSRGSNVNLVLVYLIFHLESWYRSHRERLVRSASRSARAATNLYGDYTT